MDETKSKPYVAAKHFSTEQIPDDTITVIIKAGGKVYSKGINLEPSVEATARLVGNVMQTVLDTVDLKKLKATVGE